MPPQDGSVTINGLIIGLVSGGAVNVTVLIWLALQWVKVITKVTGIEKDIYYLRREVAYVNGRAEPDDGEPN